MTLKPSLFRTFWKRFSRDPPETMYDKISILCRIFSKNWKFFKIAKNLLPIEKFLQKVKNFLKLAIFH